ncbi:TLC domain-containing protein 1 [Hippoglossus hippoglossus]|uniref:TLC domain-containing protein 1 n=1 Tax=Hippoglossus hippoglossus TaxID=8267 RepID=UPI00148DA556|nr:TLC domain-containing protein 1 [Hippoglossus hippoglossus]XP_035011033.1 TLC domain-containing protein 1 [Hippoglossus stenolepis]
MEALLPVLKSRPGLSVLVSSLIFRVVHQLLQRLPVPKVVRQDDFRFWKWKNLSVSMVHSLLTGTWALTCVLVWPETLTDLHSYHTPLSYLLVCVSTGYFVQDAADIILTGHGRGSWEFLLHHSLVIGCFLYALFTQLYVAGAVIALFVEVNSVTLHLRLMLKLSAVQSSSMYHINKFVNLFTYVLFRMGTQLYLSWYILNNYSWMDRGGYFLISMMMMNIMILIYFYRLIRADFFPRGSKSYVVQNGTHNNNTKKFLSD